MNNQIILLFVFIFGVVTFNVEADDWAYWRGPNRNGISSEKGWDPHALANGAKILWQTNVEAGYSAVAVKGDLLYTMGNKNDKDISKAKVVATSSKIRCWTAPVLSNGKVYIRTNTGTVVCVDISQTNMNP